MVPLHAYAVVDVREDTLVRTGMGEVQERRVRVLNPWKRGRTRMDDGRAWTRDMLESLVEEAEDEEADEPPGETRCSTSVSFATYNLCVVLQTSGG